MIPETNCGETKASGAKSLICLFNLAFALSDFGNGGRPTFCEISDPAASLGDGGEKNIAVARSHRRASQRSIKLHPDFQANAAVPIDGDVATGARLLRTHCIPYQPTALRHDARKLGRARLASDHSEGHTIELVELDCRGRQWTLPIALSLATTAGCPAFAYEPSKDATVVERLKRAGAIVIGKTNLDQFATGLVGVRSPYGVPRNAISPNCIPGGSSSGSAVAVAAGLVPLALGTDTAGSGRVPAALNNIVGLKPSLGLISTAGVVPACRSLDCISLLTLTTDDAWTALAALAGIDSADAYSRARPVGPMSSFPDNVRLGVPETGQRMFFDDHAAARTYDRAIACAGALGARIVEIDMAPFYETARLLYEGPWVAERTIVVRRLLDSSPDSIHPVTRQIIAQGARLSAVDAFLAFYRLEELRRASDAVFCTIDALLLPTAPTVYTVEQVLADPIRLNNRLGIYTNFVNLLDLCALALPSSMRDDGLPFGVTFIAPAGRDTYLASIGRAFHANSKLPLGALGITLPQLPDLPAAPVEGETALR
jgi:allophanate hydrolase